MKTAAVSIAVLLAAAVPGAAAQPVPYLPVPKGAAVILNTGSTNAFGYRVVVQSSGAAESISGAGRVTASVPAVVTSAFFRDLAAAMPLSKLRVEACMKSASFGTMTFVWWRGQRSPDISCPGSGAAQRLYADATAIADALHVSTTLGPHTVPPLPNEPRHPLPSPLPVEPWSL